MTTNDRFFHSASPIDSREPMGEGSVWWALRLDDMDPECARFVARLHHRMMLAHQDVTTCDYQRKQWAAYPFVRDPLQRFDNYVRASDDVIADRLTTIDVEQEIARAQYDYLRELLEAAYIG